MNREQVIKHSNVIKWFCDNPERGVWYRMIDAKVWKLLTRPTFQIFEVIVQNDKYAEFRKAQADGKQIQYRPPEKYRANEDWFDATISSSDFVSNNEFRIKPDEPTFKEGDWVFDIETESIYQFKKHMIVYPSIKLWEPQEGEWCWFRTSTDRPFIAKFLQIRNSTVSPEYIYEIEDGDWLKSCEPFIGTLPSNLKDK